MKHKIVGVQIHYLLTTNSNEIKVKDVLNMNIKSF